MSTFRRNLVLAVALATCATGPLTACGDDDPADPAATTSTNSAPSDDPTTTVAGDVQQTGDVAFCEAYVNITLAMSGEPDPAVVGSNLESVEENAPEDLSESLGVMTSAVRTLLDSNGEDFSAMDTPEFAAAQAEVDPYVFENCEFDATLEVTGADYEFTGLPETVPSGRVAVLFTNEGTEAHEIAVMRKNEGVTEDFDTLLQLPEEQAMEKVTPVGAAFAASTGSSGLLVGDFEPGEYIAICFIPVGTTMTDGEMTEGEGEPHFLHGMRQEFTVDA